MYQEIGDHVDLCQGDVIGNVILSRIPVLAEAPLYDQNGDPVQVAVDSNLPPGTAVLTPAEKGTVLVLTQCCDCLRKSFLTVCRVFPIEVFDDRYNARNAKNKVSLIKDYYQKPAVQPDAFYLQDNAAAAFLKSVAHLPEQYNIPRAANQQYLKENRILRLSQQAVLDLQFRLAFCFGRFATDEDYMLTDADKALIAPTNPVVARRE
jgi:hypothetical protein